MRLVVSHHVERYSRLIQNTDLGSSETNGKKLFSNGLRLGDLPCNCRLLKLYSSTTNSKSSKNDLVDCEMIVTIFLLESFHYRSLVVIKIDLSIQIRLQIFHLQFSQHFFVICNIFLLFVIFSCYL